jgi:CMP/dCMP kinase
MIIAVDGPTASGKGTLAKALAAHFGLPFMDTGMLYRAVGQQVQLNGGDPDDGADALAGCSFVDNLLDDPVLRTEEIGGLASRVSIHPAVRLALNKRQVDFANQVGGAVLDGRDIGTIIAPHADAKLFVVANPKVRAERRFAEMRANGMAADLEMIHADILARDDRDTNRADAPLKAAHDADLLDTGDLTIGAAVQAAIALVEARLRAA